MQTNVSSQRFDAVNATFAVIVLFGFNWKLVVEIIERLYTAPTTLEIWLFITAIVINTIISFIKDIFVSRHYKTIYTILFTCSICSLGLSSRWDFVLFFVNILIRFDNYETEINHNDMPKLYYLLGAFGISILLAFTSILPKDFSDFIPKVWAVMFCAMIYCLYHAIHVIKHDRSLIGTASVMYLVVSIISLTVPTFLIFFFLDDRLMLVPYTNRVLCCTQIALVIRALNFFLRKKKSDEEQFQKVVTMKY